MTELNTGHLKDAKSGGCQCIFFKHLPTLSVEDSETLSIGGVTGNLSAILKYFIELGGALHVTQSVDKDLEVVPDLVDVQICIPKNVLSEYPTVLNIGGMDYVSRWSDGPCNDSEEFQCWTQVPATAYLSKNFTDFRDTDIQLTLVFIDKPDVVVAVPDSTTPLQHLNNISQAVKEAINPTEQFTTKYATNFIVNDGIEFEFFLGSPIPYEILYSSKGRESVPMDYSFIEGTTVHWDRCVGDPFSWRPNGVDTHVSLTDMDLVNNIPEGAVRASLSSLELPPLTECDSRGQEQGCLFIIDETGQPELYAKNITLIWKEYESVHYLQYLSENNEEVKLPEGAYLGECENQSPMEGPFGKELKTDRNLSYYRKKKAVIRPLGSAEGNGTGPVKSFAGETLDGFICGTWQTSQDTYASGPSFQEYNSFVSNYNTGLGLYANTVKINTWSKSGSQATKSRLRVVGLDGDTEGCRVDVSGLNSYSSINYYSSPDKDVPLNESFYPYWDIEDSNLFDPELFTKDLHSNLLPKEDNCAIQVNFNGDINNQIFSVNTNQSGQSYNYILVDYLVPVEIKTDPVTGESMAVDSWDTDETDPYDEHGNVNYFTSQIPLSSNQIVYMPSCVSTEGKVSGSNIIEKNYTDLRTEITIRKSIGDQLLTDVDLNLKEISDQEELVCSEVYCEGNLKSMSMVSLKDPTVSLCMPSLKSPLDTSPNSTFNYETIKLTDYDKPIGGPFVFQDEKGVSWNCYQLEEVQLYFTVEGNVSGKPSGDLEPLEGDIVCCNNACVKTIEVVDTYPTSEYESVTTGKITTMSNGVEFFIPHGSDQRTYFFTEVCCDSYTLNSTEWIPKCIFKDGDISNESLVNKLPVLNRVITCLSKNESVISSSSVYFNTDLSDIDPSFLTDSCLIVDCEVTESGDIAVCVDTCYEFNPPVINKKLQVVNSLEEANKQYKKNTDKLFIKSFLSGKDAQELSLVAIIQNKEAINKELRQLSLATQEFIINNKDNVTNEQYSENLLIHSKFNAEVERLVKNSIDMSMQKHGSRAQYLTKNLNSITTPEEVSPVKTPEQELFFTRGDLLQVRQCSVTHEDSPYSQVFYLKHANSSKDEFEEVTPFDVDANWTEVNCDYNSSVYNDSVVKLCDSTLAAISLNKFEEVGDSPSLRVSGKLDDKILSALEDVANTTHLVEGLIEDESDPDNPISAYTVIDSEGNPLFKPRPLSDLGFKSTE